MLQWVLRVCCLDIHYHFQTHTQAERKIVEAKREALVKEASENVVSHSSLSAQLAALDSIKPHPYGTLQAVNIISLILPSILQKSY